MRHARTNPTRASTAALRKILVNPTAGSRAPATSGPTIKKGAKRVEVVPK